MRGRKVATHAYIGPSDAGRAGPLVDSGHKPGPKEGDEDDQAHLGREKIAGIGNVQAPVNRAADGRGREQEFHHGPGRVCGGARPEDSAQWRQRAN